MYHPSAGLYEYIEIQNLTATVFDIASWKVTPKIEIVGFMPRPGSPG